MGPWAERFGTRTERPCVLLIEDNPLENRFSQRLLERRGCTVTTAFRGDEGLQRARSRPPDLILLDLNLPGLDGFEVMRMLRADPRTEKVPIVCVTGEADPAGLLAAASKNYSARRFLRKPLTGEELFRHIQEVLREGDACLPCARAEGCRFRFLTKGQVRADLLSREVFIGGRSMGDLSERRFRLLCALLRAEGPLSRGELLDEVWGGEGELGLVGLTVMRLRQDLEPYPGIRIDSSRDGYELIG